MPDMSPSVRRALGQIAAAGKAGRFGDAERLARGVLSQHPGHPHALLLLGQTLHHAGRSAEAVDPLAQAAADPGTPPQVLAVLFQAGLKADRPGPVVDALERAVADAPDDGRLLAMLGAALGAAGRQHDAIAPLARATALDPANEQAWLALLRAHQEAGDARRAHEAARDALAHHDGSVALWARRAELAELLDDFADARAAADRAIALGGPDRIGPRLLLARVDAREQRFEEAEARLRPLLETAPADRDRVTVATLLAEICDRGDRPDEAMGLWADAQARMHALTRGHQTDPDHAVRILDGYRRWIETRGDLAWPRSAAGGADTPVFFVGFPRSGTTLVEQMLAAHPRLVTTGEQPALSRTFRELQREVGVEGPAALEAISDAEAAVWARRYRATLATLMRADIPDDARVVDKLPLNLVHLPVVRRLFPEAPVIVALRDPRDCCLSCFAQVFEPNIWMSNFHSLERTADIYARCMSLWLAYRDTLGLRWLESRYEDVVADPEAAARRLIAFVGEDWDDQVLAYRAAAADRYIRTPSYTGVRGAIHGRSVARWRRYAAHFEPLRARLGPLVEAFGYDP